MKKIMQIVKNYIVAEEKVAKVVRFSLQHFLPATFSAYKILCSKLAYKLPHELPNDLRFMILEIQEILEKSQYTKGLFLLTSYVVLDYDFE